MPRSATSFISALSVLLLAACGTPKGGRVTGLPPAAPPPSRPKPTTVAVAQPVPVVQPPPVVPAPATNEVETPRPVIGTDTWVSLERFSQAHGLNQPQRAPHSTNLAYRLATDAGTFVLTIGSRVASWNGLNYWLGYAPQLIDNRVFIHGVDAEKNLQPLLQPLPTNHNEGRVIVIDPGHGGENAGTKSVINNGLEKEYTLDWAMRLRELLVKSGWTVYLTRKDDIDLPLPDRVAFAEQFKADLFISLHFNSATPNREASGIETYCLTPVGLPSSLVRESRDDVGLSLPNNAHDLENFQYAFRVHSSLMAATRAVDRGVKRARFMGVLVGQNRPAVLIEGGFLSNPEEARRIATSAYRQKLAEAVAKALE